MNDYVVAAASALWLGVLTSLSPCPLATNIAAISYIGRRVGSTRSVLLSGMLYTLGRVLVYVLLAVLLLSTTLSTPGVSVFLQKYMHLLLGPVLILVGMFLLELLQFQFGGGGGVSAAFQARVDAWGMWGALLLGVVFALAFCPTSAALFFGNLVASLNAKSFVVLPLLYGLGTALPVVAFVVLIALGSQKLGQAFQAATQMEHWARRLTGAAVLGVGLWLTLESLFPGD